MMTLRAHYDGRQIQVDEPINLKPDTKVLIVVPELEPLEKERRDWEASSLANFSEFYEGEPDIYTDELIIEPNPEYRETR